VKITVGPEGPAQRLALLLDLGPTPAAQAFFPMMSARSVMAGVRLGVHAALARAEQTPAELAARLGLDPAATHLLLEALETLGHLRRRGERYALTRSARRFLDPASPTYVGTFIELNYLQWEWWSQLEPALRGERAPDLHARGADDPAWPTYVRAMYELARLSAPEVSRRLPLPRGATRLLDLGGAHGWFAADLCRRHPGLRATVVDLPGSVRTGRAIIGAAGMDDRVDHVEGDALSPIEGGPYDAALCFQLLHHFSPEQNRQMLGHLAAAIRPGGTLAILEYLVRPRRQVPGFAALIGLHYFLTSGAAAYRRSDLEGWLGAAGFERPRFVELRRMPLQTLCVARRRSVGW
jgi:2-polyprenyl-3-methyl-5-hydroxy-6-metoxy-1,4-benzoquinol methylase